MGRQAPWTPRGLPGVVVGSGQADHSASGGAPRIATGASVAVTPRGGAAPARSAPLEPLGAPPLTVPVSKVDSHLAGLLRKRPFPNRDNFWFGTATRGPRAGVGRRRAMDAPWTRRGRAVDAGVIKWSPTARRPWTSANDLLPHTAPPNHAPRPSPP